jgi:hypothetical protein
MINSLLSSFNLLNNIHKDIKKHKNEFFDKIISPLFIEFEICAKDYLNLFNLFLNEIDNTSDWNKEKLKVIELSELFHANRIKILATVKTYLKIFEKKYSYLKLYFFFNFIESFFSFDGAKFTLNERSKFPSLIEMFIRSEKRAIECDKKGQTWGHPMLDILNFYKYQELNFPNDPQNPKRKDELILFLNKMIYSFENRLWSIVQEYEEIKLRCLGIKIVNKGDLYD